MKEKQITKDVLNTLQQTSVRINKTYQDMISNIKNKNFDNVDKNSFS